MSFRVGRSVSCRREHQISEGGSDFARRVGFLQTPVLAPRNQTRELRVCDTVWVSTLGEDWQSGWIHQKYLYSSVTLMYVA